MVTLSPVGLAAAPMANQVSFLATFKENLCRKVCATSSDQPQATVVYRHGTPTIDGTTVFVPVTATITIVTPIRGCDAATRVINERFVIAFNGQAALPTAVTITNGGIVQGLIKIVCGKSSCYAINQSMTVAITPPTTTTT